MLLLALLLFFQEEHYYLDGVEIRLVNGTVIKTASPLKEELYFYSWEEGSATVNLEKNQVESIQFFSMRVPGRAPQKKTKTAAQRRLTGKTAAYSHGGRVYFRYRHVDRTGRSAEGKMVPNRVNEMRVENKGEAGFQLIGVRFKEITPNTRAVFRFYNLKGARIYESFLNIPSPVKKQKKQATFHIKLPEGVKPQEIGLIEVITQVTQPR